MAHQDATLDSLNCFTVVAIACTVVSFSVKYLLNFYNTHTLSPIIIHKSTDTSTPLNTFTASSQIWVAQVFATTINVNSQFLALPGICQLPLPVKQMSEVANLKLTFT